MKKLLLILAILLGQFCSGQNLKVTFDTISVEIPGEDRPWITYKDLILAFYETSNPYSSGGDMHFYIINSNGKILEKVNVPEELQTFYVDLYIRNDTVFTTEYWDQNTYYLDFNNYEWIKTRKGDDLIYEDEEYYVTSLNFGEWGGSMWIIDKETKNQYEAGITTPIVNRYKGEYYIVAGRTVYKLTDPTRLKVSGSPYYYENVVGNLIGEESFFAPSNSKKGLEIIFQDTTSNWKSEFHIATSFIQNDQLYYLCVESNKLYVGQIENMEMHKVYDFNSALKPIRWHYHYRNRIQNNKFQSLQFATEDEHLKGLFIFNGEELQVKFIKNSYRIPVLGSTASMEWFLNNFNFYFENLDSLYLMTVDSIENKYSATDITPRHKMSTDLKREFKLETPKCFRKIEDSLIVLVTQYYYTASDKKIHAIKFEWNENSLFEIGVSFDSDYQNYAYTALAKKLETVKENLIRKFGKPTSDKKGVNWMETAWKSEEYTIILHSNKPQDVDNLVTEVELTFYKN